MTAEKMAGVRPVRTLGFELIQKESAPLPRVRSTLALFSICLFGEIFGKGLSTYNITLLP